MLQELRGDDGKIVKMFLFQPPGLFSLAWAGGDSDDPEVNLQIKYTYGEMQQIYSKKKYFGYFKISE